jgi:hypothetical protein
MKMGTRADFYIGRGPNAEWLGSVAWDGDEWEKKKSRLMRATTADAFRAEVAAIANQREDFTSPTEGWPWPWDDSNTTDYAYVFHDGTVEIPREDVDWFPNMASRKNVQWGKKSGIVLVIGQEQPQCNAR